MTAQRIHRLRPLAHQQITGAEHHAAGLLVLRLHRNETHRRASGRLADGLRIRSIVLLPPDERLDVNRQHQPDFMPEFHDPPAPPVGAGTGFHGHRAIRLRRQEVQNLVPHQFPAEHHRSVCSSSVQPEPILCQVDSDHADLFHGRSLLSGLNQS